MIIHEHADAGLTLPVIPAAHRAARAEGLHLSTIIHDLCRTLDPARFAGHDDEAEFAELEEVPIIWLGMAFEERLERTLDHQHPCSFRPDEMQYRGIYLNADRVAFDAARPGMDEASALYLPPVVEEHKLTRMSGNHDIDGPKFRHWFWQLMFYCAAFDTTRGRLRTFFVNADYRFGKTPLSDPRSWHYRVWDLRFTPQEIDDNTRMLLGHAQQRGWR